MKLKLGLCQGRHNLPAVDGYVFANTVDPTDIIGLTETAWNSVPSDCDELDLYVTGLTPATLAVVYTCQRKGINLTCWHYNRDDDSYFPQTVISGWHSCWACGNRMQGDYCPSCGSN